MTDTHLTKIRLDSFGLAKEIVQGIEDTGFSLCTPIQAETLPIALAGRDVAGQAQTGTGKTAAFLLATLQRLLKNPPAAGRKKNDPRAIMLAPTRELAVQIHKDAEVLAKHTGLKLGLVYGGTGYESQRQQLEAGVDILIGTPGRLIDYYKQRVFDLGAIEVVVLDEADRMFDLGFIKDIRYLLRRMPPPEKRQGLLFSATLSCRVTELAYEHMNNPQTIKIETDKVTADNVKQACYMTANEEKIPLLIGLLRHMDPHRTIIFVNTKREADRVWGFLEGNGLHAAILSGDVPQNKRLSLLRDFQSGNLPIMVATDVAARGLHIPDVSHVINYDLPEDAEDYVHRIGRTARAGASGDAISFACENYAFSMPDIEAYIGHKLPMEPVTTELLAAVDPKSRIRTPERPSQKSRGRSGGSGRPGPSRQGPAGENKPHRRRHHKKSSTTE
jgi:ATP-dependent RNA helicase RhlB